jgi:hypothetical protein
VTLQLRVVRDNVAAEIPTERRRGGDQMAEKKVSPQKPTDKAAAPSKDAATRVTKKLTAKKLTAKKLTAKKLTAK